MNILILGNGGREKVLKEKAKSKKLTISKKLLKAYKSQESINE